MKRKTSKIEKIIKISNLSNKAAYISKIKLILWKENIKQFQLKSKQFLNICYQFQSNCRQISNRKSEDECSALSAREWKDAGFGTFLPRVVKPGIDINSKKDKETWNRNKNFGNSVKK